MTSERWQKIKSVLEEALEREHAERAAYLDGACQGDGELRLEVEALLASESEASDFIETPVFRVRLDDTPPLSEGERIGAYRIVREIGRGGMGSVYLAERADQEYRQKVALKVLRRGMDTDEIVHRFRSERQILANLNHENIAKLLDGGTTGDGRPFFVMEHVEGSPIDEYCDARGLSTRERLELFRKVCSAVHLAHQNLVVHRDLKPGNILVTADGLPKLLDFGIAKLLDPHQESLRTRADLRPMTPEFASPEQVRGETITTASDTYSLGVLLYNLLTGHAPYRPSTRDPLALVKAICETEPPRPSSVIGRMEEVKRPDGSAIQLTPESVSRVRDGEVRALRRHLAGDLDTIVLKAMQKDSQRRYASVDQLSNDIGRHLEGLPVIAQKDTLRYRARKFVGRHWVGVSIVGLFLLMIAGAAVTVTILWQQAVRERERAEREKVRAEREKVRAEEVADFMQKVFEVSNPGESRGADITARQLLDSGVKKVRKELANQPEVRAELMDSMGRVYRSLGLYEQALNLHKEALRLRYETLGNDHVAVAESLQNLGTVLRKLGKDDEAEPLFRRGLQILQRSGPSIDYASALTNMGAFLEQKERFGEAEKLYRESLATKQKLKGVDPMDIGRSYNNIGKVRYAQGDYAAAEENYRTALAIYGKVVLGRPDPEVAITLNNLGTLLDSQERLDEAEKVLSQALEMKRHLYDAQSPEILSNLNNLALVILKQRRPAEAEPLAREALVIANTGPKGHPNRGVILNNLAMVLVAQGKGKEGEPLAREAFSIFRKAKPDWWRVATAESVLGSCLATQGRYAEAERLLLSSYEKLRKDEAGGAEYITAARERIVDLYTKWRRPERAAAYRAGLQESP